MIKSRKHLIIALGISIIVLMGYSTTSVFAQQGINLVFDTVVTSAFPNVDAYLSINDENGLPLRGITQDDVQVFEEGIEITDFTIANIQNIQSALSICLLIDTSGSMAYGTPAPLDDAVQAAVDFIGKLRPADEVGVISFNSEVVVKQPLTTEKDIVSDVLYQLVPEGDTALYEAIYQGVGLLQNSVNKKVIILITDGVDSSNSEHGLDEAIQEAKSWHIPIFTIGIGNVNQSEMEKIVSQTGGYSQIQADSSTLMASFNAILQILREQYVISYVSNLPADSEFHTLEVNLNYQGEIIKSETTFTPEPISVQILEPQAGVELSIESKIVAQIEGPANIAQVSIFIDDEELAALSYAPYEVVWDLRDVEPGTHIISISVLDVLGNKNQETLEVGVRKPIIIEFEQPQSEAVIITSPTITLFVDSVLAIESVAVNIGGETWEVFSTPPYEKQWPVYNVQDGEYTLQAVARDIQGNTATAEIKVYVGESVKPPAAGITHTSGEITVSDPSGGNGTVSGGVGSGLWILIVGGSFALFMAILIPSILRNRRKASKISSIGADHGGSLVLVEAQGLNPGVSWPLDKAEIRLGRKRDENDIPLMGLAVSRKMAVIQKIEGQHIIFSVNPQNPIMVNGKLVQQQKVIQPGDTIVMGENTFYVKSKP